MILNPEKCHYICLGKDYVSDLLRFCGEVLEASELETELGIQIDNFENHIKSLCSKSLPNTREITNILKSVRCAKEQSFVHHYYKISAQLFPTCLMTKNECAAHRQKINVSMKEIYKFENDLSPSLIDDMIQVRKTSYNRRHFQKIANSKKTL